MAFFGLIDDEENNKEEILEVDSSEASDAANLRLRKEELDISKNSVQTGEVVLHKDIVEEEKTVNVPVSHEQVVIERKVFDAEPTSEAIGTEESIRIPVNAEQVHVDKYSVVTGEVSAHKRSVEETEQVKDVLRREEAHVHVTGNPEVIDEAAVTSNTLE